MLIPGPATSWQPGEQGVLLVLRLVTNLPSPSQPEVPKQYTYTATIICLQVASMLAAMHMTVGSKPELCMECLFCNFCSWQSEIVYAIYAHGIYMV